MENIDGIEFFLGDQDADGEEMYGDFDEYDEDLRLYGNDDTVKRRNTPKRKNYWETTMGDYASRPRIR